MSASLPGPLVPGYVDLRGYDFMPFFGDALQRSEFNKTTDDTAWRFGVMLWWEAWGKQCPAASLPDDDVSLAQACGLGRDVKTWRKIRDRALHGFVKCSDGRLYHKFLSEHAIQAWDGRVKQRMKTTGARIAALKKRMGDAKSDVEKAHIGSLIHDLEQTLSQTIKSASKKSVTDNKKVSHRRLLQKPEGEREVQGEVQDKVSSKTSGADFKDPTRDGPPPRAAPLDEKNQDQKPEVTPRVALAVELRKLGVPITADHPQVLDWIDEGVTVPMAREAIAVARMRKPDGNIAPKYLAAIIADMLDKSHKKNGHVRTAQSGEWWESDAGIQAKGAELKVAQDPDPAYSDVENRMIFKAAVFVAAGDGPWCNTRDATMRRLMDQIRNSQAA